MNQEKLSKLQEQVRIGGKGSVRRKNKRPHRPSALESATRVQATLKKINAHPVPGIEEANFFRTDGTVLHFNAAATEKMCAAMGANAFYIPGPGESKELTELMPGILAQLGPESIEGLKRLAAMYQAQAGTKEDGDKEDGGDEDGDIPELVEDFEAAATVSSV